MQKDWFEETQEIIDLFFTNSKELKEIIKIEKQKGNKKKKETIKKVREIRAKYDKSIKIKKNKK